MSWSTCVNGTFCVVNEAHRLGIVFDLDESSMIDEDKVRSLYDLSFRHFIFRLFRVDSSSSDLWRGRVAQLGSYLSVLEHLSRVLNPLRDAELFVTIVTDCVDVEFARECVCEAAEKRIELGCLVIDLTSWLQASKTQLSSTSATFAANMAMVPQIDELLSNIRNAALEASSSKKLVFGFGGIYDRGILQLLFDSNIGQHLRLAMPGAIAFPNIRTRIMDFVHSRLANSLHLLSHDLLFNSPKSEESSPLLFPLMGKYPQCKSHSAPIILKYLLQICVVVGVPASLGTAFIEEYVCPVTHPFANRREFVAPSITKRFVIDLHDVEHLKDKSEEIECKEDEHWKKEYLHKRQLRKLTDQLPPAEVRFVRAAEI